MKLARAREALRSVFGYHDFRPGQEEVIGAVLDGEDVLAVMPTGSGKSMCYQLPALVDGGLTVVVSPLIALMRDQVQQMAHVGVAAATLNSSNGEDANRETLSRIREGTLSLLFVSPERLALLLRHGAGTARPLLRQDRGADAGCRGARDAQA